ncbi:WD40/YVTN/BNR-like repeat-containing protein [Actinoplanes sp. NPDC048988]|uniref:WD40/YVTN/BNR-like repeat-containing protein n=1 Tax=Actinoplanes sp. NPDC048988 TaxID=3363901 RepID=UPI003715B375
MTRTVRALVALGLLLTTVSCARSRPAVGKDADRTGLGTVAAADLGFERHAGAVEWPASSDWVPPGSGVRALMPLKSCVLALGDYQNGYRAVNANWTGTPACDRLRLDPAPSAARGSGELPDGWPGGGVSADAAVAEPGGTILAASSSGLARYRNGEREELARADLSKPGFEGQGSRSRVGGMVRTSSGRIIINADLIDAAGPPPAVLISNDNGRSLRRVNLPAPGGPPRAVRQLLAVLAADGDTVVAIGYGWERPGAWRSTDGGRTWRVATVDGLPEQLILTRIVHSGGRWTAFGGVDRTEKGEQDTTYVLTSTDGLHWKPGPTAGLSVGRLTDVTVDRSGTMVATGVIDDSRPTPGDYCGVVWLGDGTRWQRGELGCGDAPPQAVTTLRDGRVLIAGNRDLWLRAAAP